jgi:putative endonuclease
MKIYFLYIIASESGVLYIGVTNNLIRRVYEHKNDLIPGFTQKYKCKKLVYFEQSTDIKSIIAREKQLKKWRREKKVYLIEMNNPEWKDLSIGLEMT